jgi:predicted anti-sigma-YlaC factor YlaD
MWSILDLSLFYSAFLGDTTLRWRILAEARCLSITTRVVILLRDLAWSCRSIQGLVFHLKFSFLLLSAGYAAC